MTEREKPEGKTPTTPPVEDDDDATVNDAVDLPLGKVRHPNLEKAMEDLIDRLMALVRRTQRRD
jgi:hypothetical protein